MRLNELIVSNKEYTIQVGKHLAREIHSVNLSTDLTGLSYFRVQGWVLTARGRCTVQLTELMAPTCKSPFHGPISNFVFVIVFSFS